MHPKNTANQYFFIGIVELHIHAYTRNRVRPNHPRYIQYQNKIKHTLNLEKC